MKYYLDIRLLPDPEFSAPILMNALCGKFHRALVAMNNRHIGISFPESQQTSSSLGGLLRIHGDEPQIQRLMKRNWLTGMSDHVWIGDILPVPANTLHRVVRRVQRKTNAERLRRRYMKRHQVSREEALQCIPDSVEQRTNLPFLRFRSQSTGHNFCLFVEHLPPQDKPVSGPFNRYGLSNAATVPWF